MTLPNNSDIGTNLRSASVNDLKVFNGAHPINTPVGIVHSQNAVNPPIPPRPMFLQPNQGYPTSMAMPYSMQMGGMGGNGFFNSFGGYGSNFGGYNNYGGYSNYYRGMNSNQYDPMDPESRFIQLAEESSRSTFQSIESIVGTIGNIATLLDSTYFALISSFRAILGVAANFSRIRGFLAQFFGTFKIFQSISWLYRKILYALRLSNVNPSTTLLNEVFNQSQNDSQCRSEKFFGSTPSSGWPILLFLGFIMSAPYLIMRLYGSISQAAIEESKNPKKWVNAIQAEVLYNFNGTNSSEIRAKAGQKIIIAPKEIQQANRLLQTSWLMASIDNRTSGLIPVNYIKRISSSSLSQKAKESNESFMNEKNLNSISNLEPVVPAVNIDNDS